MTDFSIGSRLRVTVFGQSHAPGLGVVIEGYPAGREIDLDRIQSFLDRRAPGKSALASGRKETDRAQVLSGLNAESRTCMAPVCALFTNADARPGDYEALRFTPRPGHADYPAFVRSGGEHDYRGGGEFSGRMTAPLCFAGALCLQELERAGIRIGAHISQLGLDDEPDPVRDRMPDPVRPALPLYPENAFPVTDAAAGEKMKRRIADAQAQKDSIGGEITCWVTGLSAGLGGPLFGGVEGRLAAALLGIPAVKGVQFGDTRSYGSVNNDAYTLSDGRIVTITNNSGGVTGGITNGMPLYFTVRIKPTPSIGTEQQTVDLRTNAPVAVTVSGRHDPCILPRAVPVVEAVTAFTLLDLILCAGGR